MKDDEIYRLFETIEERLDGIAHDLQQIKTSQRASQKRERKVTKVLGRPKKS